MTPCLTPAAGSPLRTPWYLSTLRYLRCQLADPRWGRLAFWAKWSVDRRPRFMLPPPGGRGQAARRYWLITPWRTCRRRTGASMAMTAGRVVVRRVLVEPLVWPV